MKRLKRQKEAGMNLPQNLSAHQHEVWFNCASIANVFSFHFFVKKLKPNYFCISNEFSQDHYSKNWGLWNTDVVEVFLQNRKSADEVTASYFELQVSPLNQPFALLIEKPRVTFHIPENLSLKTESKTFENELCYLWESSIHFEAPFATQEIYLNVFACLGHGENREYFAFNPNLDPKPDFHRPEFFLPIQQLTDQI